MPRSSEPHRLAALRHEEAASNHDRSATFWAEQGNREQAGLQRELADYERLGAALERKWAELMDPRGTERRADAIETTRGITQKNAERLSSALDRTADALDQTADMAEQHARRHEESGRREGAEEERQAARRARDYAQRARTQAEEWRKLASGASR